MWAETYFIEFARRKKTILATIDLIGQKILAILRILIFPATEICAELCFQSPWRHCPQLSAKFEPWMKNLSVLDMKQQYLFKVILIRGITLFSTGIISWIPCFIDDLLLYVAYVSYASCFGNSTMVTECQLKPFLMNFGFIRRGEGDSCVEIMVQDWIGQKKKTILATIFYLFLLL